MSASPHFAKLALPLFLEKFTSAAGQSMVSPLREGAHVGRHS